MLSHSEGIIGEASLGGVAEDAHLLRQILIQGGDQDLDDPLQTELPFAGRVLLVVSPIAYVYAFKVHLCVRGFCMPGLAFVGVYTYILFVCMIYFCVSKCGSRIGRGRGPRARPKGRRRR